MIQFERFWYGLSLSNINFEINAFKSYGPVIVTDK